MGGIKWESIGGEGRGRMGDGGGVVKYFHKNELQTPKTYKGNSFKLLPINH